MRRSPTTSPLVPAAAATVVATVLAATAWARLTPPLATTWPPPHAPHQMAIVGAHVLTVTGPVIDDGTVLVEDGRIRQVGPGKDVTVPAGFTVVNAGGGWLMPGIIDTHSHMGVYPWPDARGNDDGNEMVDPVTPQVKAEDAIHLEDPAFERARAGGVTSVLIIPGSGNLEGGQGIVVKLRPVNTLDQMRFEGAPRHLKMAFGENPKRVYGAEKGRAPMTRMGNAAVVRESFQKALEYEQQWADYEANKAAGKPTVRPEKDPRSEVLLDVLHGRVRVNVHCYRKDDLLTVLRIADEFKFKINAFHHCLEGYKIAGELARRDVGVCTWADWWGFKMEAWDGIPQNAGLLAAAGVRVSIHSDSSDGVQRLWHEAAKAVRWGMAEDAALKALTYWPATILGIEKDVGSIEVGKSADLALFTRHPFDMYTHVQQTFIDGVSVHDDAHEGDE